MSQLVKNYIGKECYISAVDFASDIQGIIRSVEDNWLEVETDSGIEIVNIDFVTGISEYQERKKGKKKVMD